MESQTFQAFAKAEPTGVSSALYTLALTATSDKTARCWFIAGLIRPAEKMFGFICALKFHMTLIPESLLVCLVIFLSKYEVVYHQGNNFGGLIACLCVV